MFFIYLQGCGYFGVVTVCGFAFLKKRQKTRQKQNKTSCQQSTVDCAVQSESSPPPLCRANDSAEQYDLLRLTVKDRKEQGANKELALSLRTTVEVLETDVQCLKLQSITCEGVSMSEQPWTIVLYKTLDEAKRSKKPRSSSHRTGGKLVVPATTVSGICKPGVKMLNTLSPSPTNNSHCEVLIADTNDLADSEQKNIYLHLEKHIVSRPTNTEMVIATIPHRAGRSRRPREIIESLQAQGEGHKDPPGIWIKQASGPKEEGGQDTPWVHHGTNNSPPPNKDLVTIGGGPSTIQIPDMTFTSKNTMAIQHKDKTAGSPSRIRSGSGGRAPHKDMTDDLTPPRKTTERMVMGSTDDDSEEYAVVTKKRKNRSSPTHDPRTSKKDKVEAPGTKLTELSTDEDSDDTGKEEDAIELTSYDAIDSSISLVLGKLRLLQKKAGSAEKVRDIEKELHSVLRKARMLHEENLTLRARLEERSSIIKIFKETVPPQHHTATPGRAGCS
ncbi:hypothetical protein J6590_064966 [Homalodisca vitripennis]|nr:hypothetical protein J6590_064966 [Homalodisca vitripennis]